MLFDLFKPARSTRTIYCHQDFLEKLEENRTSPVGKRASLLMQRLTVDLSRLQYKPTYGENRGWRRSRLGGTSGSHFYAWWATSGSPPVKANDSLQEAGEGAIFLRDIRHHDDHSALSAGKLSENYLPVSVGEMRDRAYAPEPWTQPQSRFAKSKGTVRILKGHPGSGKTSALLNAADESLASRVLYLTFSKDLASLARDYFDCYCDSSRSFTVLTFPAFLRQLLGLNTLADEEIDVRQQFRKDLAADRRSANPWLPETNSLYDEMHAHLTGCALPEEVGRFRKAERIRLPEKTYLAQRSRYISEPVAKAVLEAANRLERLDSRPLVDRYFPEFALAWRAAHKIAGAAPLEWNGQPLDFDCIAIDECQDLTPLESYVLIALARRLRKDKLGFSLLLAGDEAQTVRPTDFEWAWLNDMLHAMLATPLEFKLNVNLRSPRGIADLVNRAWDLYRHLDKRDRPSGAGYAEIEDDAPDQVLYSTATPGEQLNQFLAQLSAREGCAIIAATPDNVAPQLQGSVLSVEQSKGLDFQTVCILDAGKLMDTIHEIESAQLVSLSGLRARLAIDRLRVAISRPTERLIWLDVRPKADCVRDVARFLRPNLDSVLQPITLEALEQTLGEEELDLEERLQRCQEDARKFVSVKPDLAWSRAQQAIALLGSLDSPAGVTDLETRNTAYLVLAEICFRLALQKAKLSPELGNPDLFVEGSAAAMRAKQHPLATVIRYVGILEQSSLGDRLNAIANAVQVIGDRKDLPGWMKIELVERGERWVQELERNMEAGENAAIAMRIIPPFIDSLGLPNAAARREKLVERCIQILVKSKKHALALEALQTLPERRIKLEAECWEGVANFARAAALWEELGELDKALRCYRNVPDFEASLRIVRGLKDHPALESLEWLAKVNQLAAKRPEKFAKVMTMPEKKLLQEVLERSLGVQKKKAAPRKTAAKKAAPKKPRRPDPPF